MKKHIIGLFLFIFSSSFCFGQSWQWVKEAPTDSVGSLVDPLDLTTDKLGNIYETGLLGGYANFGAINVRSYSALPNLDAFLVKFDNTGTPLWAIDPINTGDAQCYSVAADKSGNSCIIGNYSSNMSIGAYNFPTAPSYNFFIAMFSASGVIKWAAIGESPNNGSIHPYSVTLDKAGNSYVTGYYTDSMYLGPYRFYSPGQCFFLAKYDTVGSLVWAKAGKPNENLLGQTVVTDSSGNVYVTGQFLDSLAIDTVSITSPSYNIFLAKFNPASGKLEWLTSPTLSSSACFAYFISSLGGRFLSIDPASNLYITGILNDSVQFGPYSSFNNQEGAIFITKYTPEGKAIWAKESSLFSQPLFFDMNVPYSISCSQYGFYLCGRFSGNTSIGFNSISVFSDSISPSFLFAFDTSGKAICAASVDNLNDDNNCVAADPLYNDVFFSGDVGITHGNGVCYFGSYMLNGLPEEYGFLAQWECEDLGVRSLKSSLNSISLFPNPNNGQFTLTCHSERNEESNSIVEVYNMLGEKVYTETLKQVQGDNTINLSSQPNGVYLYRVIGIDGALLGNGKFVIEK